MHKNDYYYCLHSCGISHSLARVQVGIRNAPMMLGRLLKVVGAPYKWWRHEHTMCNTAMTYGAVLQGFGAIGCVQRGVAYDSHIISH